MAKTRMVKRKRTRVWLDNPPGTPRVTVEYEDGRERVLRVTGLLDVDQAAQVLMRSPDEVRGAIRAGLLKASGRGGQLRIRVGEVLRFREEERVIVAEVRRGQRRYRGPGIPMDVVFRRLGLQR